MANGMSIECFIIDDNYRVTANTSCRIVKAIEVTVANSDVVLSRNACRYRLKLNYRRLIACTRTRICYMAIIIKEKKKNIEI